MKSPLQAAFEKLTDAELAAVWELATDTARGPAGRLAVIEGAIEFEMTQRGTAATARTVNAATDPEAAVASIVLHSRSNQAAVAHLAKGMPGAMHFIDDPAFQATAAACVGENWQFGDQAIRAAESLDERFFKTAAEAVRAVKSRRRDGGDSPMLLHIRTALTIFHEGDATGKIPQRKMTKQALRGMLETRLGSRSFSSKSESWPEFFKRPEIAPFVEQRRAGGRPETSGKKQPRGK